MTENPLAPAEAPAPVSEPTPGVRQVHTFRVYNLVWNSFHDCLSELSFGEFMLSIKAYGHIFGGKVYIPANAIGRVDDVTPTHAPPTVVDFRQPA